MRGIKQSEIERDKERSKKTIEKRFVLLMVDCFRFLPPLPLFPPRPCGRWEAFRNFVLY